MSANQNNLVNLILTILDKIIDIVLSYLRNGVSDNAN